MAKSYDKMTLEELEAANQQLDTQLRDIRAEKLEVSRQMDRRIHYTNAQARFNEMSMEERIAMRDLTQGV